MKKLLIIVAGMALSASASASLIVGGIGWGGEYHRGNDNTYTFSNVEVDYATNDLAAAGISDNDNLAMSSFNITSFLPTSLWNIGGFSFLLNSIQVVFDMPNVATVITGTGTLTAAGYDDRLAAFTFSSNAGGTFSASVPEPTSVTLLALALAGLGLGRRNKTTV